MRWLRNNRRFGSWLALAALALQLAVSFGHVHVTAVQRAAVAVALGGAGAPQGAPPGLPGKDGDDHCVICATIHLAGNVFPPPAPQLPPPPVARSVNYADRDASAAAASRRAPFHSRAPPLA